MTANEKEKNGASTPQEQVLGEGRLCGVICIHVDDMFGGGPRPMRRQ